MSDKMERVMCPLCGCGVKSNAVHEYTPNSNTIHITTCCGNPNCRGAEYIEHHTTDMPFYPYGLGLMVHVEKAVHETELHWRSVMENKYSDDYYEIIANDNVYRFYTKSDMMDLATNYLNFEYICCKDEHGQNCEVKASSITHIKLISSGEETAQKV